MTSFELKCCNLNILICFLKINCHLNHELSKACKIPIFSLTCNSLFQTSGPLKQNKFLLIYYPNIIQNERKISLNTKKLRMTISFKRIKGKEINRLLLPTN